MVGGELWDMTCVCFGCKEPNYDAADYTQSIDLFVDPLYSMLEVQTGMCTCARFLLTVLGSLEFAEMRETFASPQPLGIGGFICLFLGLLLLFCTVQFPKPQCSISTVHFRVLFLSLCVFSLRLR
jgi:hypothetical protein